MELPKKEKISDLDDLPFQTLSKLSTSERFSVALSEYNEHSFQRFSKIELYEDEEVSDINEMPFQSLSHNNDNEMSKKNLEDKSDSISLSNLPSQRFQIPGSSQIPNTSNINISEVESFSQVLPIEARFQFPHEIEPEKHMPDFLMTETNALEHSPLPQYQFLQPSGQNFSANHNISPVPSNTYITNSNTSNHSNQIPVSNPSSDQISELVPRIFTWLKTSLDPNAATPPPNGFTRQISTITQNSVQTIENPIVQQPAFDINKDSIPNLSGIL